MGMLLGGALGSGKPQEMVDGFVSGEKGVDKVPAMLSDGEFVMSVGAVQKYGVDTLEGMNAAGGGTNKPKMMGGKTYAAGGGPIGDVPEGLLSPDQPWWTGKRGIERSLENLKGRLTGGEIGGKTYSSFLNLTSADADKLIENLRKDPRGFPQVSDGGGGIQQMKNLQKYQNWLKETYLPQSKPTPQPQSFTESSRKSAGLDDLGKQYDLDRKTNPMRGYADDLPKLNTPKSKISTIPTNRMLPSAGQSSANAMKPVVRAPIPASRAIVPARGSGFRAPKIPKPNILKNMKVPGGFSAAGLVKGAKTLGVELLLQYFLDKGMNYLDAKRISGIVDKASKAPAEKRDAYIESVRKDLDKEKRHQKSLGGIFDKIIKMGGETGSEYMSKNHEALLSALGSKPYEGGAIKGGFGLKDQSFKDAPKTQIMTDDKGKPFVGHKSMKNGKLHYSRGPQPGTGTSNPFESFGRAINPGAYKDNDAKLAMQNQRVAATNSLESYQKQGMFADAQGRMMKQIGANSNQTQNDLKYRKNQQEKYGKQLLMPTTKPKVNVIFGDIPQKSAFNPKGSSSASPKIPSISSTHPKSEHRRQILAILGVK